MKSPTPTAPDNNSEAAAWPGGVVPRTLGLWDSISIIIGTIIGAGLFQSASDVARAAVSPAMIIALWLIGGLLALAGALCFVELMERLGDNVGGDYWFLRFAFGRRSAFVFAWASFWIIRPGNVGLMALIFAQHARGLWPGSGGPLWVWTIGSIIFLSGLNMIGVRSGKSLQNGLSLLKILGLAILIGVGWSAPGVIGIAAPAEVGEVSAPLRSEWWQGLVFVMFAYGGWNDLAFVSAEIREPQKNLFRALTGGTLAVMLIYLLLNGAFLRVLGVEGLSHTSAVVPEMIRRAGGAGTWWGEQGAWLSQGLIAVICLSAINSMLVTSPRIYAAVGQDYRALAWLGIWSQRRRIPVNAIAVQCLVTVILLTVAHQAREPFESLMNATSPVFWGFLSLSLGSLLLARRRQPQYRGFRAPGGWVLPLVVIASAWALLVCSLYFLFENKDWGMLGIMGGILVSGIVVAAICELQEARGDAVQDRKP